MGTPVTILEYLPNHEAPEVLTFVERDEELRIIFLVPPMWLYWLSLFIGPLIGSLQLVGAIAILRIVWHMTRGMGTAIDRLRLIWSFGGIATLVLGALFWILQGAYEWWTYKRWGRVPRVLIVDAHQVVSSKLGLWRIHRRRWASSEITTIEIRELRWRLNTKRFVFELYLMRNCGWPIRFRLSSPDAQLPTRIAEAISTKLNCSLIRKKRGIL